MATAQSNVNVNITANTADLDAKLAKQEKQIKTLDGAINILGGSVELAASAIVATGIASEETAKNFESTALAAIAFADGSKRVLDGAKSLNEGIGGLKNGFIQLFNVLKANPIAAVVTALAAAAIAYENYASEQRKNARITKEELKLTNEINAAREKSIDKLDRQFRVLTDNVEQRGLEIQAIEDLKKAYPGFEAFLTRENELTEKGIAFLKAKIQIRKDEAALAVIAQKQVESEIELESKILEIRREEGFTTRGARLIAEARQKQKEETAALNEQEQKYLTNVNEAYLELQKFQPILDRTVASKKSDADATKAQTTNILSYNDAVKQQNQAIKEGIEGFIEATGGIEQPTNTILKQLPVVQGAVEQSTATFADYLNDLITQQNEFFEGSAAQAISSTLNVASNLARVLSENIDDSNKEGFEKAKKYRIAETRVTSIQAAFEAYKGLIGVPYVGQFLAIAGASAALIAGQKAIQDIQSSTFNDTNAPSNPVSTTGAGGAPRPISGQFAQGGFLAPGSTTPTLIAPQPPIQAYVLASDVTNGLQAYGQISRRRRFG